MISSIPVELANLPVLSYLALCDNRIQSIPPQFTRYTHAYLFDFFSTVHSERHLVNRVVCAHHVFFFLFLLCHSSSSVFLLFPTHSLSTFLSLTPFGISFSVSVSLSLSLSFSVGLFLFLSLALPLPYSVCLSLALFISPLSLDLFFSLCSTVYAQCLNLVPCLPVSCPLSLTLSACFFLFLSLCLLLFPSPSVSPYLSLTLSCLCPSLSVCLSVLSLLLILSLSLCSVIGFIGMTLWSYRTVINKRI